MKLGLSPFLKLKSYEDTAFQGTLKPASFAFLALIMDLVVFGLLIDTGTTGIRVPLWLDPDGCFGSTL